MDESKPDKSLDKKTHGSHDDIKGPNVFERAKDEFEAIVESIRNKNPDSPSSTPTGDIKGPNVFERAKDEFEAIVESIRNKNPDSPSSARRGDATFAGSKYENQSTPVADKGVKLPKVLVRSKDDKIRKQRDEIDVNTPMSAFKGPNVFVRVKDEFEAIVETMRTRKDDKDSPSSSEGGDSTFRGSKYEKQTEDVLSSPDKSKQEGTPKKKGSRKETHGRGEDIDPDTPVNEFKGPSIFHRAKEEIEAIVDTIKDKKESDQPSPKKEGGFRSTVGKKIKNISNKGKNRE